jgi:hypothetical protein
MSPQYIHIQIRRPSRDDPGQIEDAHFIVADNVVHLTDQDGNKLKGELTRRPIGNGDTAREVAVRLLRTRVRSRPAKPFSRQLRYPNLGKI